MAFQKGQSGNPGGQPKEKPFLAALNRAIVQKEGEQLRVAAEKVLELAAAGEQWAVQFVADRTDGKPSQQQNVEHSGEVVFTWRKS